MIFFVSFLSACALLKTPVDLDGVPLPQPSALNCCWQSSQLVAIDFNDTHVDLSSVLVVDDAAMRMITFDKLGRKLFMLEHDGGLAKVVRYIDIVKELPIQWIVPAVYLTHADLQEWSLADSGWSVEKALNGQPKDEVRTLYFQGRPIIVSRRLNESLASEDNAGERWQVEFIEHGLKLKIDAEEKIAL